MKNSTMVLALQKEAAGSGLPRGLTFPAQDGGFVANKLPDVESTALILMKLERPLDLMAWIMCETGARLPEIQAIRQSDYAHGKLRIQGGPAYRERFFTLSSGLTEALQDYRRELRHPFETGHGFRYQSEGMAFNRASRFSSCLLFPLRSLEAFRHVDTEEQIPSDLYGASLQIATRETGYIGGMHSHTFRLACAKKWIDDGMEPAMIHERLGHRDLMTTMLMIQALTFGGICYASVADDQ